MNRVDILLVRKPNLQATPGELFINGVKVADTLEAIERTLPAECPYTANKKTCVCIEKLCGDTCIPKGTYRIEYKWLQKYGCYYPMLAGVPHFLNVVIRTGNNPSRDGSILVGQKVEGRNLLRNSFAASSSLRALVKKHLDEGKEIFITIK